MSNKSKQRRTSRRHSEAQVIRLTVLGDPNANKAALISTFAEYLSRSPPRRQLDESDSKPVGDGDVGYDAIGRRVCVRELPAHHFNGDEFAALAGMPKALRDHLAKTDGAVIVVNAADSDYETSARKWRHVLGGVKSECPALLVMVMARGVDEHDVADFVQDLGIIAWRAVDNIATEHDAVLDAFGTILDYVSATLGGNDFDIIDDDDIPPSSFGITCAGTVPGTCALS